MENINFLAYGDDMDSYEDNSHKGKRDDNHLR